MRNLRTVLVLAVTILGAVAWATRLEVVNVGQGGFYLVNRWTGAVTLVTPGGQREVLPSATPLASGDQ